MTTVNYSSHSEATRRASSTTTQTRGERPHITFSANSSIFTQAGHHKSGTRNHLNYNFGEIRGKNYGDHFGGERPHHGRGHEGRNFFAGGPNGDYGHRQPRHEEKKSSFFSKLFKIAAPLALGVGVALYGGKALKAVGSFIGGLFGKK